MAMTVGIQLYSVRNSMASDPVAAIKQVLDCGYTYLEAANHNAKEDTGVGFGIGAKELKAMLDGAGAKIVSAHVAPLDEENFDAIIEYNLTIGNHNIVYPMEQFSDRDDILRKCERYNTLGERMRKAGIRLLYHNHFHEFMTVDGEYVMDIMMENTNPEFFGLELDTFWAMRAGMDPVALIRKYGRRIGLLHQKDMAKNAKSAIDIYSVIDRALSDKPVFEYFQTAGIFDPTDFTEIGTGIMDIQQIIDAGNEIGCEYVILEQDFTQLDEIDSIRKSMDAFRKFEGISWT